jgi:hypothetical protein
VKSYIEPAFSSPTNARVTRKKQMHFPMCESFCGRNAKK